MADEKAIKLRYLKMFFIGPPRVGKTLTRLRLCNEMKNMITRGDTALPESTLLANCKQMLMYINPQCEHTWITSNSIDEEAQILVRYMYLADQTVSSKSTAQRSSTSVLPTKSESKISGAEVLPLRSTTTPQVPSQPGIEHSEDLTQNDHPPEQESETNRKYELLSMLQSLIQTDDYSNVGELIESSVLVNIHDIGGQPGFLEMIPSLISGPAAYLVFLNLDLPLNQSYEIPFSRENSEINPFTSTCTVESTISQILSAISSIDQPVSNALVQSLSELENFASVKPVATLVGTHLDKLENTTISLSDQLQKKHKELKKITDNFQGVVVNPAGNKSFLAIDNFKGTEKSDLSPLRAHIMDLITGRLDISIPIPPTWLLLSIILRKEFQVAPMEECMEIGKLLNMENDVKLALEYLHYVVGALMYYPEIQDDDNWFKNNIICSPQVIFDSISQIIIGSMQIFHSDVPIRECFRRDWIEKGLFSIEAIKDALRRTSQTSLIPIDKLVKLLEHVNLLSRIHVQHPQRGTPSVQLFMPAILECATFEELTSLPPTDANHPAPIFLKFESGYVPTGVFCGLVTHIVSKGPSKIFGEKWELKNDHVKRNKVSFFLGGLHVVTLIAHDTSYEIRVERKGISTHLHDLCSQVLITVLYILKEAYRRLEPIIAFQCPCDKHVTDGPLKHMCTLSELIICTSKEGGGPCEVQLREEQKVWIGMVGLKFSEILFWGICSYSFNLLHVTSSIYTECQN